MTLFCLVFAAVNGACLVYLDETYEMVRPWLAAAGCLAGLWGFGVSL